MATKAALNMDLTERAKTVAALPVDMDNFEEAYEKCINEERHALIEKQYAAGRGLSASEKVRLDELQRYMERYVNHRHPLPFDRLAELEALELSENVRLRAILLRLIVLALMAVVIVVSAILYQPIILMALIPLALIGFFFLRNGVEISA